MKDNQNIRNEMVWEFFIMKMEMFTLEIGREIKSMDRETITTKMEIITQEISKIVSNREKEVTFIKMGIFMKEIGKMMKGMDPMEIMNFTN